MNKIPISVIILTKDEELNIADCIKSLERFDEVIVVDSGSSDRTVNLAKETRADVGVFEHPFMDFGDQRNWALDNVEPKYEWIMFLDADERCTPALGDEIECILENPQTKVGYYLCCRNFFLGSWIKHCTFYPSWQLRILKHGAVSYRKEGHGQREVTDGPLGYITEPYDHFGFSKGLHNWIARHNNYSTMEVELIQHLREEPLQTRELFCRDSVVRRRAIKRLAARTGFRPLLRFLYTYIWRGGILDGYPGLVFCLLRVAHEIHITAKLAERRR